MKTKAVIMLAAFLAFLCAPIPGMTQEPTARMSDKQVENLVKNIDQQQQKFARALDSDFRRSVARGPGGEIEVSGYLDDLKSDIERLDDRFDGSYSASAEVENLLARADMMHGYIHDHPEMKGANEWDVFASSLQRLAGVYGTTFPLPDDPAIRRIGDGELEDAGSAISKLAKDLKSTVLRYDGKAATKENRAEQAASPDEADT